MGLFAKEFKEVVETTLPITVVIFLLQLLMLEPTWEETATFLVGVAFVISGFTLFLAGVEVGVLPAGNAIGAEIPRRQSLVFIIGVIFTISFLITVAEPDVNIFAQLVHSLYESITVSSLVYGIASGVAFFLIVAALKIVYGLSIRILLTVSYAAVVVLALVCPPTFLGIAFDSGGVTTGPMTVPILLSLGVGISSVVAGRSRMDGFGMIGLASVGPMIAILVMGILSGGAGTADAGTAVTVAATVPGSILDNIWEELVVVIESVAVSVGPLLMFLIVFQKLFLKYSWRAVRNMVNGILITAVGMVLFLTGVYLGFMKVALELGAVLINMDGSILIGLGFLLGLMVILAEPAVKILCMQVEEASNGILPRNVILVTLCIGVAAFVAMGMAKIVYDIDFALMILTGYAVALVLMWLTDRDIVGIAFDAGGVATGPMAVAVIMTLYAGLSAARYSGEIAVINGFGIIAMIALAPLISVSVLGIIIKLYRYRCRKTGGDCE